MCYWPGGRCPIDAPLADGVGWVADPADLISGTAGTDSARYRRVTKTVGSVVITGVILNPAIGRSFREPGVVFATSGSYATSIGVAEGTNLHPIMEFSISVPQPQVQMKVEDIDSFEGTGRELVRLGNRPNPGREADVVQQYRPTTGPPPGVRDITWSGLDYEVHLGDENALLLQWHDNPWGDGTNGADPVSVQYMNLSGAGRGSGFDFGGPIFQTECTITPRRARLLFCCEDESRTWIDTDTGEELSPEDVATIDVCGPHHG